MKLAVDGTQHDAPEGFEAGSLLTLLRDGLGLTATKNACEHGECGSCTVKVDGVLANACLVLAAQARDAQVETVAGLTSDDDELDPVQQALIDAGAVQCGFCTPGMVMAARNLLDRVHRPTEADVREALTGNLCRCTGYELIVQAVLNAGGAA